MKPSATTMSGGQRRTGAGRSSTSRCVKPKRGEVRLLYLEGKWSGDQVNLTTTLVAPETTRWERNETGEEATVVIGGHPDTRTPITFSLERGTFGDFEARCKRGAR